MPGNFGEASEIPLVISELYFDYTIVQPTIEKLDEFVVSKDTALQIVKEKMGKRYTIAED